MEVERTEQRCQLHFEPRQVNCLLEYKNNNPQKNKTQSRVMRIYFPKSPVFNQKLMGMERNQKIRSIPRKKDI